jgi:hypothetical protein
LRNLKFQIIWYSINNGVKLDSYILIDNKSYWEFFYFDERGETSMWTIFDNEDKALDYLWVQIERNIKLFKWNKKK